MRIIERLPSLFEAASKGAMNMNNSRRINLLPVCIESAEECIHALDLLRQEGVLAP